ncbi:AAA family ATPase [Kineosporia sp. R_H_3]|uniref:AAA family ATPase n=1 Tax=Kineosporia sp. R_H_3 TaxID=1961848 RepID=UPI000B4AAF69|nr:AAA family ATPase [Kineosporia sp. R_H_3]
MTTICDLDPTTADALRGAVGEARVVTSLEQLRIVLDTDPYEDVVVLGPSVDPGSAFRLAAALRISRPTLSLILVRQRIDTSLLAEAMRAGLRDVVDERDLYRLNASVRQSQSFSAALRESAAPSGGDGAPGPRGKIVTVFSAKGGCGKTTLATNLAATLADRGRRQVCLVDLDLAFGDVAIALQLFPAHTIADAVPLADVDFTAVQALLTPHSPGLTTLVAPVEPGSAESIPASLVAHILELLRQHFDYVVVDTPPAFDDQVLAAFDLSDVVALIATLDIPALKNLKLTLETMALLNYPRERWRIVLNRADSKVGLAIGEVEKTLRAPISVEIPSSRDVPASINRGVPIALDDPRHPVSLAIKEFADRHILGGSASTNRDAAVPPDLRTDRRGFFRRRPQ